MVNRFLEVMAMALLLVMTIGTTFQVLNFQMLRDIQQTISDDRATPIVVEAPPPQFLQFPAPAPTQPAPQPTPAPVPAQPSPQPQPETQPTEPIAAKPNNPAPLPREPQAAAPVPAPPPEEPSHKPPENWKEYEPHVLRLITQLFEGQYDDAYLRFTPRFAEKLSKQDLAAAMDDVRKLHGTLGALVQVTTPPGLQPPNSQTFRVRVGTSTSSLLQFSVTMTPEKTIDGLLFIEVTEP